MMSITKEDSRIDQHNVGLVEMSLSWEEVTQYVC
jgi:hypothetical protein